MFTNWADFDLQSVITQCELISLVTLPYTGQFRRLTYEVRGPGTFPCNMALPNQLANNPARRVLFTSERA